MKILELDDFGFNINVAYKLTSDDEITITNVWIVNQTKEIDVLGFVSDESYERIAKLIVDHEGGIYVGRQKGSC